MQNFTAQERIDPLKRGSNERKKDFKEIYEIFKTSEASVQADRCVQCGDPYCHNKCPLHNYIPQWLRGVAKKDIDLSFKLSNETNPFRRSQVGFVRMIDFVRGIVHWSKMDIVLLRSVLSRHLSVKVALKKDLDPSLQRR